MQELRAERTLLAHDERMSRHRELLKQKMGEVGLSLEELEILVRFHLMNGMLLAKQPSIPGCFALRD